MRAHCPFELRSARAEPWHGTDQNSTVYTAIEKARTALGYEITNITNISIKLECILLSPGNIDKIPNCIFRPCLSKSDFDLGLDLFLKSDYLF